MWGSLGLTADGFAPIANVFFRNIGNLKLKSSEALVLMGIFAMSRSEFRPGFTHLENTLGMARSTIDRSIKGLVKKGLLKVKGHRTPGNPKLKTYNEYDVTPLFAALKALPPHQPVDGEKSSRLETPPVEPEKAPVALPEAPSKLMPPAPVETAPEASQGPKKTCFACHADVTKDVVPRHFMNLQYCQGCFPKIDRSVCPQCKKNMGGYEFCKDCDEKRKEAFRKELEELRPKEEQRDMELMDKARNGELTLKSATTKDKNWMEQYKKDTL